MAETPYPHPTIVRRRLSHVKIPGQPPRGALRWSCVRDSLNRLAADYPEPTETEGTTISILCTCQLRNHFPCTVSRFHDTVAPDRFFTGGSGFAWPPARIPGPLRQRGSFKSQCRFRRSGQTIFRRVGPAAIGAWLDLVVCFKQADGY